MPYQQKQLINSLLNPAFYDHPVTKVELVETHISRIFLAGEFAYKLKKPLNLGFLDFSTLQARHFFCQEELRLNRRFAPQLYLAVRAIGGTPDNPELAGQPVLDYMVKMRRFPTQNQLDELLQAGHLTTELLESFAKMIATFHHRSDSVPSESDFGSASAVTDPVLENFAQLKPLLTDTPYPQQLELLEQWSKDACAILRERFTTRKNQGLVKECHGDLHLANMVWWQQPLLFDCIEFDPNLRWIDVLNEVAFLAMDLDDRGAPHLGWAFLNSYLRWTGDYQDLDLLAFYKVYRAMVRTKIISLRLNQPDLSVLDRDRGDNLVHSYLSLATSYIKRKDPIMIITHGLSGSGKTSFIAKLASHYGAISIHSDIERKRLVALAPTEDSHSAPGEGIYSSETTLATYLKLEQLAEAILTARLPVIVDATFLQNWQRERFRKLAEKLKISFTILDFQVTEQELKRRIRARRQETEQASEADEKVLDLQLASQEPLTAEEIKARLRIQPDSSAKAVAAVLMN